MRKIDLTLSELAGLAAFFDCNGLCYAASGRDLFHIVIDDQGRVAGAICSVYDS